MFDFVAIQSHKGKAQTTSVFILYFKKWFQDPKYIFQLVFFDFDKIIQMIKSLLDVVSLLKRLMNLLYADFIHIL